MDINFDLLVRLGLGDGRFVLACASWVCWFDFCGWALIDCLWVGSVNSVDLRVMCC